MTPDHFVTYLKLEKRSSEKTITAYKADIYQFTTYCKAHFELNEPWLAQTYMVRAWLAELKANGMDNRTINRKKSALNSYFEYCLTIDGNIRNPVKEITSLKIASRTAQFVSESDMQHHQPTTFEDFKALRDYLIVEFLYQTGIRKAELLSLQWSHFDFSRQIVKVMGKGNKQRVLPLAAGLTELIKLYQKIQQQQYPACPFFINTKSTKPMSAAQLHNIVVRKLSSLTTLQKKSPHVLRHTFATHLLNNGAPLIAIKELLGHSSLAATQIYTHNSIAQLKKIHQQAHPKG